MPAKLCTAAGKRFISLAANDGGSSSRILRSTTERAGFFCPSCSSWRRRPLSTVIKADQARQGAAIFQHGKHNEHATVNNSATAMPTTTATARRYLSSSASGTNHAIGIVDDHNNCTKNIPLRFRELYTALRDLERLDLDQVSLSRLQLAQRGLESERPVVRIAVFGINDARTARRLVRLLLADPLTARQSWEDLIESYGTEGNNGLLIRYGDESGVVENPLCPTIEIRSPLLRQGEIELFVSTLGSSLESDTSTVPVPITDETLLVPTITVPTTETAAGHETVRYPAHKTIICGVDTDGLLAYSKLVGRANMKSIDKQILGAIDFKAEGGLGAGRKDNDVIFVNSQVAESALNRFRESVTYASEYERGWTAAGVQPIINWLSGTKHANTELIPDLQRMIESLLDTAEASVTTDEASPSSGSQITGTNAETRRSLDRSITVWAERAHTELRNSLDEGFASRRWKSLSWWKLFWRVDDVGSILSEILQTRYLLQSEKEMIWTAGRVKQNSAIDNMASPPDFAEVSALETKDETDRSSSHGGNETTPWPPQIANSRLNMLRTTISSLQALSQGLVLFSASTTVLTSSLSALLYTSASTGLYEACTIAAVGLVYSLRRQQLKWEAARATWESEVREAGRAALNETEEVLRTLASAEPSVPKEDNAAIHAKEIIARTRKALENASRK